MTPDAELAADAVATTGVELAGPHRPLVDGAAPRHLADHGQDQFFLELLELCRLFPDFKLGFGRRILIRPGNKTFPRQL
ncbi:MAG: hypothetical protein M3023_06655 [Pseudomonadota bacterium]|nr:hypothetical protein [Pseudomonadota bacterium]